jgi:DNA helicase-4
MNYFPLAFVLLDILLLFTIALIILKIKEKKDESKNKSEITTLADKIQASSDVEIQNNKKPEEMIKLDHYLIEIISALDEYDILYNSKNYFAKENYRQWLKKWSYLEQILTQFKLSDLEPNLSDEINRLTEAFVGGEDGVSFRNRKYIEQELSLYNKFFDSLDQSPLTKSQRRAVIVDEKNNLIVAGAGTGKTKTILAKTAYLVEKKLAKPSEILILAFNNNIVEEIERKIGDNYQIPNAHEVHIETFHSFGRTIIAKAESKAPDLSNLATDKLALSLRIQEYLDSLTGNSKQTSLDKYIKPSSDVDGEYLNNLVSFLVYSPRSYTSQFEFKTLGEYYSYIQNNEIRTLNGEKVKSQEECLIANYLYLNGIPYKYEEYYKIDTSTSERSRYRPDFYLPSHDIYIEHFALNDRGAPPPFYDEKRAGEYLEQINWKRLIHSINKTTLVETYSYENNEGNLLTNLEERLIKLGVTKNPIPPEIVLEELRKKGIVSGFVNLLGKFLNLFKSSGLLIEQIQETAKQTQFASRAGHFLNLFEPVLNLFQDEISRKHEIDFHDMINKAAKLIEKDGITNHFKYILVDEFQDISQCRFKLLKALQKSCDAKLFCVGDDWQAINRFAGGDVSLMTQFYINSDPLETSLLEKTWRFNSSISEVSTRFVSMNPDQIKKQIEPREAVISPAVSVVWISNGYEIESIERCINDIEKHISSNPNSAKILILGRYREKPEVLTSLQQNHPHLEIEYMTAHASKGGEADFVIVTGLKGGVMGFPCLIEDDPLLSLVLAKEDLYPNAEERRLFYVALTRTRNAVYLLADADNPSQFIVEMIRDNYPINQYSDGDLEPVLCPECQTGILRKKKNSYGTYFICSNEKLCSYHVKACNNCGQGVIHRCGSIFKCSNSNCNVTYEVCPGCDVGYLVKRGNDDDPFFGCSNYPLCRYTRNLKSRNRSRRARAINLNKS